MARKARRYGRYRKYRLQNKLERLAAALIELQFREDEICSTAIFCGVGESFLRVMVPRPPKPLLFGFNADIQVVLGKTKSFAVESKGVHHKAQRTQRKQRTRLRNFIEHPI